jgi:putative molybdopterin biosynthesis protein
MAACRAQLGKGRGGDGGDPANRDGAGARSAQPVKAGDIIEYNSLVLAAQVNSWGGEWRATRSPQMTSKASVLVCWAAQEHDLILLNAGSSAGSEDFSARVVESLGVLLVHGVAVRPGHPVILGMIGRQKSPVPVIGVPGYPVSAALTGEIFVRPLLASWLGQQVPDPVTLTASLTRKTTSPAGMTILCARSGGLAQASGSAAVAAPA